MYFWQVDASPIPITCFLQSSALVPFSLISGIPLDINSFFMIVFFGFFLSNKLQLLSKALWLKCYSNFHIIKVCSFCTFKNYYLNQSLFKSFFILEKAHGYLNLNSISSYFHVFLFQQMQEQSILFIFVFPYFAVYWLKILIVFTHNNTQQKLCNVYNLLNI